MNKKITQELINQQLNVKRFSSGAGSSASLGRLSDPIQDTPMVVTLDDLRPYEHNPRKTINPLYQELKESIRTRGLDQPPPITRRPNEDHFIIRNGGNTRLEILRELWKETKDEKYFRINCLFKPWESEINALAGHLAENELHGQMSFIDKARGVAQLKEMYEEDSGEKLTLRALSAKLKADGYPAGIHILSHMLGCVELILPALPITLTEGLSRVQISRLIELKNNLEKVWNKYDGGNDFFDFWMMVLSGQDNGVDSFSYDIIQDEMISQMAMMLDGDYATLELDLAIAAEGKMNVSPLSASDLAYINANPPTPRATPRAAEPEPEPEHYTETTHDTDTEEPAPVTTDTVAPVIKSVASSVSLDLELDDEADKPVSTHEASKQPDLYDQCEPDEFIQAHIVSPTYETPAVRQCRQIAAQANGERLREFDEAVLESIPVMAGGPNSSVSDVWYIEKRIRDIDSLRYEIWLLVDDICRATGVTGFKQTHEGLGFGIANSAIGTSEKQEAISIRLLLTAMLRATGDPKDAPFSIPDALFSQIMVGGCEIQIGHGEPTDVGLARLADPEFVKIFRIMRLARYLVDLLTTDEQGASSMEE